MFSRHLESDVKRRYMRGMEATTNASQGQAITCKRKSEKGQLRARLLLHVSYLAS